MQGCSLVRSRGRDDVRAQELQLQKGPLFCRALGEPGGQGCSLMRSRVRAAIATAVWRPKSRNCDRGLTLEKGSDLGPLRVAERGVQGCFF